jgi:hypothetical protein
MADRILNDDDVDRLGQALIMLTKEVWVLRDRQRILEAALEEAGVLDHAVIDAHAPDAKLTESLAQERQQLIDNVLQALDAANDD